MNDVIRLLPDSVANQIAAGEVIQRPASVVKELVENAVDAGATDIQIIIRDAGRTLIQVIDNGSGMSDTDARMAFERHATSKIAHADDLFTLRTMGFRGEALASIVAVARVDVRTRLHDSAVGTRLVINGSVVESQEPDACTAGTNIMVKSLFFNVPARRKFLKKDPVELANIMREFERLALVNPDVEFTLVSNDSTLHQLTRGSLKQRIVQLFGKALDKQLLPVETVTPIVSISGFVGHPQNARRRGALQYLFVNGRNMRHPYFHKAIMTCYEPLVAADEQPNYFIDFQVDPHSIDVNIHPTKNEIKFEDEKAVWQILVAAVRESLGRFNGMPGIDFDSTDVPEIPVFSPDATAGHDVELDPTYNPFAPDGAAPHTPATGVADSAGHGVRQSALRSAGADWDALYREFAAGAATPGVGMAGGVAGSLLNGDVDSAPAASEMAESAPDSDDAGMFAGQVDAGAGRPGCLQLKGRYILSACRSGLMIVDQHRAHVRILFERFMTMASAGGFAAQQVMFPEVVTLSPAQGAMLRSMEQTIGELGFELSYLGDNSWSLNAQPAVAPDANGVRMLTDIIDSEIEGGEDAGEGMRRRAALAMARAAAVKAGAPLAPEEMERMMSELFALPSPNYTPDGLPVVNILTSEEIARMFA